LFVSPTTYPHIHTLSLHDALPIFPHRVTLTIASARMSVLILDVPTDRSVNVIGTSVATNPASTARQARSIWKQYPRESTWCRSRSEEHTSELPSRFALVCRLLLEK